jgi:peroxiredoxin Q/BCP
LEDQNGNRVKLSDYRGKKLLVYFYPKANTPGCTNQACSVRDAISELSELSLNVVGISPDPPEKQKKFEKKYNLNFPLLSDSNLDVSEAYGVWGGKSIFGKKFAMITRSSILIDEEGKVDETWYRVKPRETVPKAIESVSN